jgi:hypothetical protein
MMSAYRCVYAVWLALAGIATARAATVTWDGGGGDFSWQNPANWNANTLPGTGDDAVINIAGNATITTSSNVTIRSLQCSNSLTLAGGTFRVTAGASIVQGQFSVTGSFTLSATGAGTSFTGASSVSANTASFEAVGGARVSLPGLAAYSKGTTCLFASWRATGVGSALEFSGLSVLTGGSCGGLEVQALSGGIVSLTNLATITEGAVSFLADGTNSQVDLGALQESPATLRTISFEARNSGTVSMPQFPGGPTARVTLSSGGVLPVAQLRCLNGFTVAGAAVDFPALTNLTSGHVTVSGGAVVTVPNLVSHDNGTLCSVNTWLVSGAGSVLDLSPLTNLKGGGCGSLAIRASAGGTMILSNLPAIADGGLVFAADGANSLVDLGAVQASMAVSRTVSFEARNGGTMWMPQLPGGPTVRVVIENGGVLPVAQLRRLNGFTVAGMAVEFPALTNLTPGNITVSGGAMVTLPNLMSHVNGTTCFVNNWEATGAGSVLDLSHLTSLVGSTCGSLALEATAGGTVVLSHLPAITEGNLTFAADGTNSLVDLSALEQSLATSRTVSFEARNQGTVWMPQLPGGPTVRVTLSGGGQLPVAQLRQLNGFAVTGMTVDFPALTNLTVGDITVSGGALVTIPNLTSHSNGTGCIANSWEASGAGSVLDFPRLASLVGSTCGSLALEANAGGRLVLGNLTALTEGNLIFLADGTNSLVDLSALQQSPATLRTVSFEARNSGTVRMPFFHGGPTVTVTIKSGGMLSAAQIDLLKGLTVSGTALDLPEITNFFAGNLTVSGGAVLRLPNLFKHDQGLDCNVNTWQVSGAGSVLDLSSMTNLTGSSCGELAVEALSGGTVNLSNLAIIVEGRVRFLADGTNSLGNLGALQQSLASLRPVTFEVRNAGTISMPQMIGGPTVGVIIRSNGVMPVAQLTRLGAITVVGATGQFTGLTNFDNGTMLVSTGATVTAPNLLTYAQDNNCAFRNWLVRDTGSVLDLSALTLLMGARCGTFDIQALNAGHLLLGGVTNILSGTVAVLSSDSGSLIDLGSLANFLNPAGLSRLVATNGGAILLNQEPFILSGASVNFAVGTPNYPPTMLAASNLVLHGNAWCSYWIEQRSATSPSSPWTFFQRVPLTNEFQVIGPPAAAGTEFRVWEFVADPFALELTAVPGAGVDVVLYGPANHTFDVQATTNLATPVLWQAIYTIPMTNSFRILPREPLTTPQRFFKVLPLP